MGIEVWVRGEVDQPAATDLLVRAAAWFGNRVGDELLHATVGADRQQRPRLLVSLYPGAEDVEITLDETRLEVSGKTSTIGPGYHAYVCELLEELGAELSIGWLPPAQDEDDYFRTRDAGALELEFLNWLNGLARFAVDKFETGGAQGITVSMPLSVRFVEDSFMITPMGPRSVDWAREVARDPRRGIDVFPWWDPGKDGSYALGRAMVLMWQDVPWRAPTDDDEMALLRRVDTLLTQADTLTATSPLPWAEWGEILTYLGESRQEVETRAASSLPPQIGYRRGEAWNELSGQWWVRTPGAFVGRFEDEGSWSAFDGVLTLWFSSFAIKKRRRQPGAGGRHPAGVGAHRRPAGKFAGAGRHALSGQPVGGRRRRERRISLSHHRSGRTRPPRPLTVAFSDQTRPTSAKPWTSPARCATARRSGHLVVTATLSRRSSTDLLGLGD
ncbi:hypothetical protein [Fodinicola feengrottensis]|uniref:hypothetical protein n=1 Tax=Fodinicola feengrottensis TaxID=435914 RepID=UPI0013D79434|nr:hypothetical protein [Fodinicola feengrottensis]